MTPRAHFLLELMAGNCHNLTTLDLKDWPELEALRHTPQDPEWHAEGDVLIHTEMVLEQCRKLHGGSTLYLSALLHDIAKPETTRYDEEIKHTIAPGHERIGGIRSRYFLRELGDAITNEQRLLISQLVSTHHLLKRTVKKFEAGDLDTIPYLERLATRVNTNNLYELELADMLGRTCVDQQKQIDIVEMFKMLCEERSVFGCAPERWVKYNDCTDIPFQDDDAIEYALAESHRRRLIGEIKDEYQARAFCHEVARQRKSIPRVVLTVGVSGSGKTHALAVLPSDYQRISPDAQRLLEYGDEAHQGEHGPIYQACAEQLKDVLRRGGRACYDATNLVLDLRAKIVSLCHSYGAHVSFWVFDTSIETIKKRNRERDRKVPEHVIDRQISKFEWPFPEEYHELKIIQG